MHEAQLHERNSFVTLTYADEHLPAHGSLRYEDFQLFMRRVRKMLGAVRFYMCGEYGETTFRPHYHANLFGVDFRGDWKVAGKSASGQLFYTSERLSKCWPLGRATVQPLTREAAGYTARYIMKKALGQNAETAYVRTDPATGASVQLVPEFARMSLKPGIGAGWFQRFRGDVFPHDHVVADGREHRVPKYYDKLLKRADPHAVELDSLEFSRLQKAQLSRADNTDERRRVRDQVHQARVRTLTRTL